MEKAALAIDRQRINTELRESSKQVAEAVDSGNKDAQALGMMRRDLADQDLELNSLAAGSTGMESGRSLQAQKIAIDEDFSLGTLLDKAKAEKGEKLNEPERKIIEDHAKRIAELEAQLAARDAPRGRRKPVEADAKKSAMSDFDKIAQRMREKSEKNERAHCEI